MPAPRPANPALPDSRSLLSSNNQATAEPAGLEDERLFVERRRTRPAQQARHEALESVHGMLVNYENANRKLAAEKEVLGSFFENAVIGMFRMGPKGEPLLANRAMAVICGFEEGEELLSSVSSLRDLLFADQDLWDEFLRGLETDSEHGKVETETSLASGTKRWVELNVRAVRNEDVIAYYQGTAEDITERRMAEERLRLLAYYDGVTGLPKRAIFDERLNEELAAARLNHESVTLLVIEVSRFKMINDSLGKEFGDRLLQEVAERIRTAVGPDSTVARLGGAEFGVILQNAADEKEIEQFAENLLRAVSGEFSFLSSSLNVCCTMGISTFSHDGMDAQELLQHADVAMCSAREQGANAFQFFTEEMNHQIRERLRLENGLRMALEREELYLVYQPQVDVRSGQVSGLEALLRWCHPDMGLIPPGEFISIAESSGLIVPIGEWVLRTACRQALEWHNAGLRPVPVAVNVSAIQFLQPGFCDLIRRVLNDTGMDPKFLELELTEGLLLTNVDVMLAVVQELREMGVKLTIDDFGTGYSSLGYLRQFKVNRLKIDRSFVREVSVSADDAAIATAIINMARALNLEVLAEGVENADQLDFLRAHDCYEIQGYYFSRPVAVDQVAKQLQSGFMHAA